MSEDERREREAVYDGWHRCRTLEDVAAQEALVDRFEAKIGSDPREFIASDVAIAREMLKMQRESIERHG